ncbi:unnamed protein product [Cyclocybe aegerita]|uniref:F-box domain-containing protein n=1 Tax=Cyclocybe aegerita TaxID=1973307 RepID=A0A8S0XSN1_CYCAE|nr:unnamed protein product [Cyclocybe aegerita]
MAGFLRKKTKQEVRSPPTISGPVTLASSVAPPPLYAKFATGSTYDVQATPRVVSSPTSPRKDREVLMKTAGGGGRLGSGYSSASLAAGSRDAELARRRVQELPPSTTKPTPTPYDAPGEPTVPRPVSKAMLDKPLPSPSFNDIPSGLALPAVTRRTTANRGPPPTFQKQNVLSRSSLDIQDRESKPLPRPGSAQSYYHDSKPPPSTFNATPRRRNGSVSSTTNAPQISPPNRKLYPYPDNNYASQTLSPKPNAHGNGPPTINGNGSLASSGIDTDSHLEFTPMSVGAIDLPPEAAFYQEYTQTIAAPSVPNSLNSRRPATSNGITTKSIDQVPDSSRPQSGTYGERQQHPILPSSNPRFASTSRPLPIPSPPLPPPPPAQAPATEMGVAVSQPSVSDPFPSSYKDFYPNNVAGNMNGRSPTYNGFSNVNFQQPAALQQQPQSQSQQPPARSNSRSTSAPLPPGAALPSHYQPFQHPRQDVPAPVPGQFPNPPLQRQHQHRQPSLPYISPQPPTALEPQPPPVPFPKPASMHATSAPMPMTRGKPRIFAAMEAQESEPQSAPSFQSPPPSLHPLTESHQPQTQLQNQTNGIQRAATLPQNRNPSPNPSVAVHRQSYAEPAAEPLFMTPKSHLEPLPSFSNGVASGALDVDPALMFTSTLSASPPKLPAIEPQPLAQTYTPKVNSKSLPRQSQDDPRPNTSQGLLLPQTPPRGRKLSKTRNPPDPASINGSISTPNHKSSLKVRPGTPSSSHKAPSVSLHSYTNGQLDPPIQLDDETIRNAGIPLDDDPFARVEGVKLLKTATPPPLATKKMKAKGSMKESSNTESMYEDAVDIDGMDESRKTNSVALPLTPESPQHFRQTKKGLTAPPPLTVEHVIAQKALVPMDPMTMHQFLSNPQVLACLLSFLSFYDWCILSALSKEIRILLVRAPLLREEVLERFLKPVGYSRWSWDDKEPLSLSLQDLSDYMRGVSTPTHEYARVAGMYVHSLSIHPNHRDPFLEDTVRSMTSSTRAYTRVLLRLRAQAEKEASLAQTSSPTNPPPVSVKNLNFSPSRGGGGTTSRVSSRAPSPTTSNYSQSHHGHANGNGVGTIQPANSTTSLTFRSPLFRLRRAPLLRVFVPSPEGDWLSDKSVLECEAECKRAGVAHLMRLGDVVWDVAVGDEGNVGRLVWDGSYLIDLDYTYSAIGDLPKYMPALAFPPSYFHKVIRTGSQSTNPIAHIDLSSWGEEIAMNLQLLQDRVKTETPQGAYHNVMRWVHRSSFTIRGSRGGQRHPHSGPKTAQNGRIPIPDTDNLFVDPGWYGTLVVETEGTNEALADLQDRCGPGAFPPRPRPLHGQIHQAQVENRKVFRILRERSRPGEIWIRAVGVKERLM